MAGGSGGVKALLLLLRESIKALSLIEDIREDGSEKGLHDLAYLARATIQICERSVERLCDHRPMPASVDHRALAALQACLNRACHTLHRLKSHDLNYFGVFRRSLYLKELALLEGGISPLIQEVIVCDRSSAGVRQVPLSDLDHLIPNVVAKLFWVKFFGSEVEVAWERFAAAFSEHFDEHPEECMDKLRNAMATGNPDGCSVTMDYSVQAQAYGVLTHRAGGLYEYFQRVADPGTIVLIMGTVEDENHGQAANYPPSHGYLPVVLESFLGHTIRQVCCGGQHAAILTARGQIYTWGRGGFGRLGHGDDQMSTAPRRVEYLADIRCRQVTCGFAYTAAVTEEGQVYTWGAGENGRLGLGDERDKFLPQHVTDLSHLRVKEVFAGSVHTCALLENGQVYSWGKSEYTGHGSKSDVWFPMLLDGFGGQAIAQISVGPGGYHTIALSLQGEVFTWGHNRVGQLGYSNSEVVPRNHEGAYFLPTPRVVESLKRRSRTAARVCQVIAGWGHSAVVCSNGDVYICGRNYLGQLGLGNPDEFQKNERGHPYQANFRLISGLKGRKAVQFACGGEHSAALLANNDVYTFGAGNRGQLGHGENRNEHLPRLNQALRKNRRKIEQVVCGNDCTLLLAGLYQVPKLQELAMDIIADNSELYDPNDLAEMLHPQLYSLPVRLQGMLIERGEGEEEMSSSTSSSVPESK